MKPFFELYDYDKKPILAFTVNNFPSHFHNAVEILYNLSGELIVTRNGVTVNVPKGSFAFFDSGDVHSVLTCNRYYTLIIPPLFLQDFVSLKANSVITTTVFYDGGLVLDNILKLKNNLNGNILTLKGYISGILGFIFENSSKSSQKNSAIVSLKPVFEYLNVHFLEEITLDSLAKKFGYNKYYLSTVINDYFKMGLTEYLNNLRLQEFIDIIKANPQTSIVTALFNSGFNSPQTFYRIFKKQYGVSPKNYLRNLQNDKN